MKITSLLKHVFPLNHARYSSLPVFGPVMEGFVEWLQSQGYTRRTIRGMSQGAYVIDHWLRRRRIASTAQITPEVLTAVDAYFRPRDDNTRWANQALHRFLCERHALPASKPAVLSPSQKEAWRYAAHLREVRGLAESTIVDHSRCVVRFLESIDFNRKQSALIQLKHRQIEGFVQQMAQTHDRHSLLHVTLTVRAFLRFEFSQGTLPHPLHEQIDTPRVYAGERLTKPPSVRLHGKGRKERICPLWPETARLVLKLLEEQGVPLDRPEAVFRNRCGARLTRFGVRTILRKHVKNAAQRVPSLKHKRLHPHSIRHYADPRTMPTVAI